MYCRDSNKGELIIIIQFVANKTKTKKIAQNKKKGKLMIDLENRAEKYGNIKDRQTRKSEADQTEEKNYKFINYKNI
jgi:hypothetical protein